MKYLKVLAFVGGITLLVLLMALFAATHGAFAEAHRFASEDQRVRAVVGEVNQSRLRLFSGWELNGSTAECVLDIASPDHKAVLEVHLVSKAGLWQVESADLWIPGESSVHKLL